MRAVIFLTLFLIAATGYCTGEYVETGDNFQDGLIQQGDVFEYYCELPQGIISDESIQLRISYPNAEVLQYVTAPRLIYGTLLVVYP